MINEILRDKHVDNPTALFANQQTFKILSTAISHASTQEARVGTEHLLVAMLSTDNPGRTILLSQGNERLADKIRDTVNYVGPNQRQTQGGNTQFTQGAQEAIEHAVRHAQSSGRREILPQDILLGLIDSQGGMAAGILPALGVSPDRIRTAIQALENRAA